MYLSMDAVVAATNVLCATLLTQLFQPTPRPTLDGHLPEYRTAEVLHAVSDVNSYEEGMVRYRGSS